MILYYSSDPAEEYSNMPIHIMTSFFTQQKKLNPRVLKLKKLRKKKSKKTAR